MIARFLIALAVLLALPALAFADDRHAGYYYPEPQTFEVYPARAQVQPDATELRRVAFVVEMTRGILSRPHPPDYSVFTKGENAEKMIIVALRDDVIDNIYRARALLAQLTGVARGTELFAELQVEDYFTFYDLIRMLGFERITISDGENFAHQVDFE